MLIVHRESSTVMDSQWPGRIDPRCHPAQLQCASARLHAAPVTDYIEENLTKDLTLAEIAEVAHMSPHYFSRAFRKLHRNTTA